MLKTIESGVPGVTLERGDHVCAFYRGAEERDLLLQSFLGAGLDGEEKCLYITDMCEPNQVASVVRDSCGTPPRDDQLSVVRAVDTYLTGGVFEPSATVALWDELISGYVSEGFRGVRAVGECCWAITHGHGYDSLYEYETLLNKFAFQHPQVIMCLYDLDQFDAEVVKEILKRHPAILARGTLIRNAAFQVEEGPVWALTAPAADREEGSPDLEMAVLAGMLMAGARDEEQVADLLVNLASWCLPCDLAAVAWAQDGGWEVRGSLDGGPLDEGLAGMVVHLADGLGDPDPPGIWDRFGWIVKQPLRCRDTVLAWLVVATRRPNRHPMDTARFLQALSVQTAVNILNVRPRRERGRRFGDVEATGQGRGTWADHTSGIADLRSALTAALKRREGIQGIAAVLHHHCQATVVVEDATHAVLAVAGAAHDPRPVAGRERLRRQARSELRPVTSEGLLVMGLGSEEEDLGSIWLVGPRVELAPMGSVEYAAAILAPEVLHVRDELLIQLPWELADQLFEGDLEGDSTLAGRVRAFGVDLEEAHRVIVVRSPRRLAPSHFHRPFLDEGLRLVTSRSGDLAFLAPERESWNEFLHRLLGSELNAPGAVVGLGSVVYRAQDCARSYQEARRAAELAGEMGSPIVRFDDLGILRVLMADGSLDPVEGFVHEWLDALIQYDRLNQADFVATLSVFLDNGGNQQASAEVLSIHVSTLKYRMRRIGEVTGFNLSDPDVRFHLHVATRAWRAVRTVRSQA